MRVAEGVELAEAPGAPSRITAGEPDVPPDRRRVVSVHDRDSAIGPRTNTGTKVRPTTTRATPVRRATNRAGGGQGARTGRQVVCRGEPARQRDDQHHRQEPAEEHAEAEQRVPRTVSRRSGPERAAVVVGRRRRRTAPRTGRGVQPPGRPASPSAAVMATVVPTRTRTGVARMFSRPTRSRAGDLLAEVLRRPADHQAGEKTVRMASIRDAVEAGADTAGGDLAEHHVEYQRPAAGR